MCLVLVYGEGVWRYMVLRIQSGWLQRPEVGIFRSRGAMHMKCPHVIGRESWDRGEAWTQDVDLDPLPPEAGGAIVRCVCRLAGGSGAF